MVKKALCLPQGTCHFMGTTPINSEPVKILASGRSYTGTRAGSQVRFLREGMSERPELSDAVVSGNQRILGPSPVPQLLLQRKDGS